MAHPEPSLSPDAGTDTVRRSMASGSAWMIAFRMCDRLIGMISTVVLARLLMPEDFGVIALGMSVIAFLDSIGDFSFELALIRDQEASEDHYHCAWTARVLNAMLQCLFLNAVAGPAADLFGEPRLRVILHCLSLVVVLNAAQSIRLTDMRKTLAFRAEFNFRFLSKLIGFVVTVTLAILWRNYWALLIGTLVAAVLRLILSYVVRPYRPKLTLNRIGDIFNFSKWLILGNILSSGVKRSPAFVIGKLANAQMLGLYSIGNQICGIASTDLVAPIKRALFPAYSKLASDFGSLRTIYVENFSVIVMIAMPIAAGIGLTAPLIVPLFLGENWLGAVPVMQVLALGAAFRTVHTNSNPLFYATNNPQLQVLETLVEVGVLLPALWLGVKSYGAVGAAWATALSGVSVMLLDAVVVVRLLSIRWTRFLSATWRTPVSIAAMWYVVRSTDGFFANALASPVPVRLAACVVVGSVAYVGVHLLLWRVAGKPHGAEGIVVGFARSKLSRADGRASVLT